MTPRPAVLVAVMALAACSRADNREAAAAPEKLAAFDVQEAAPATPESAPQVAYSYTYRYTLAPDRIAAVQASHIALCRRLGTQRCLILNTDLSRTGDDESSATTKLVIDARLATAFGQRLDAAVTQADGDVASRSVAAEDVTKQLVDTQAKVRAKQALADRLLTLIRDARGSVADLVAAEKAFADVQEELDAARTLQSTLRRRVAMSEVAIDYASDAHAGTFGPLGQAVSGAGATFVTSLAAALTFVVAAIPWLLIVVPAFLALRAGWRRWRARRARNASTA